MQSELQDIRAWKTWRIPVTADQTAKNLNPAGGVGEDMIEVLGTAIMVRMFGKNADNETATMELIGRMDPSSEGLDGRGFSLWRGQVILGSDSSSYIPGATKKWGAAAATWFEVDTYDSSVSGGHNACLASVLLGLNQALFLVPTLGFKFVQMVITDINDGGVEMAELGALYRTISRQGVL